MTTENVRAIRFTCDNPRCRTTHINPIDADEPVRGFHGSVLHVSEYGGDGGEWYACCEACIHPAVLHAARGRNSTDDEITGPPL